MFVFVLCVLRAHSVACACRVLRPLSCVCVDVRVGEGICWGGLNFNPHTHRMDLEGCWAAIS